MKQTILFSCMLGLIITSGMCANNPQDASKNIERDEITHGHHVITIRESADVPHSMHHHAQEFHVLNSEASQCAKIIGCISFVSLSGVLAIYVHLS